MKYYFLHNGEVITTIGATPDDTLPNEAIECTEEQKNNYFDYKIVDNLIVKKTTIELLERDKQRQLAIARQQLDQSIKLESGVYQRRMSEEQQYEFIMYQDALLEFINGERQDMPEQPNFITELL